MERLTHRAKNGTAYTTLGLNLNYVDGKACFTGALTDRLAEYEDTGLTPEEILQMKSLCEKTYDDLRHQLNLYRHTGLTPEQIEQLKKDKEYWQNEARKWCSQLGENRMDMPYKVGDIVYRLVDDAQPHITTDKIEQIIFDKDGKWIMLSGRRLIEENKAKHILFFTKEEAEIALKGGMQ